MNERYPIAMIPYANMAPYETLGPPEGCYFVNITPRNSIAALRAGTVWAAAVPVGGLPVLGEGVEPIGAYGIAANAEVMSVLFFSDHPIEGFQPPRTVRLTDESASSVRLLYLLLGQTNGYDQIPSLAQPGAAPNGELLIGDAALHWHYRWERHGPFKGYSYMTDLAAQWYRQYQLPIVFARWVMRKDAPPQVRLYLRHWLETFAGKEGALIRHSVGRVAGRLNLPEDYVHRYLKVIRRCLTPEDLAGQTHFIDAWRKQPPVQNAAWFSDENQDE